MGTRILKLELPTWGCLNPRSCRPEQGSLHPWPVGRRSGRSRTRAGRETGKGNTCSLGPPASDSCHWPSGAAEPVPSRPVRSPALRLCARPGRGREGAPGRAADRLGTVSRPGGPGVGATGPQSSSRPRGPPHRGVPTGRARRAGPASLTRPAAVGAHVAAPEPLRHGSRFTCREPRDGRGGGCASALTGPRAALAAALPSQRLAAPADCARAGRRPAEPLRVM